MKLLKLGDTNMNAKACVTLAFFFFFFNIQKNGVANHDIYITAAHLKPKLFIRMTGHLNSGLLSGPNLMLIHICQPVILRHLQIHNLPYQEFLSTTEKFSSFVPFK